MINTIAYWQGLMIAAKEADPVIGTGGPSELSSTSDVAIWLLWTEVVAEQMMELASLYTSHVSEVQGILATQKPHTLQWYATMALAFQYGDALPADNDVYDPVAPAGDPSLIVSYAAAVELTNLVRIKVATLSSGVLTALSGPQLTAFTTYMGRIKDAGVRLQCTSGVADNWQLAVTVYYDPLILNSLGQRIDGTENTPVLDGMNEFADTLPFNGVFSFIAMLAAGEAISGVIYFDVQVCQANYGATPYVNIMAATPQIYIPDAGYLALDETYFNANVTYIPYTG